MKENEQWDGADVEKKTYAILMGLTCISAISVITTAQLLKPEWFEKIPKWEIGPTTLGSLLSNLRRTLSFYEKSLSKFS